MPIPAVFKPTIDQLIARSSLGTPGAVAVRTLVPPEAVEAVLARVTQLKDESFDVAELDAVAQQLEQTGVLDAFEQQALEAWNDDSIELSATDERHIETARARVLAFAKDCALLDWLDSPEDCRCGCSVCLRGTHLLCSKCKASPQSMISKGGDADAVRGDSRTELYEPAPLVCVTGGALSALAPAIERAADYAKRSRSEATLVAYERKWLDFSAWCAQHRLPALPAPPEVVTAYIGERVQIWGVQSLRQAQSAIRHYHKKAGELNPCEAQVVVDTFDGIKRVKGVAPQRQAYPLTPDMLRRMIEAMPWALASARDRAVLCLGFSAALRRSEIVALDVDDLDFVEDGVAVLVRKSKTDQEAVGEAVGVGYGQNRVTCPVRAVRDWLSLSGVERRLFRSIGTMEELDKRGKDVTRIVKRAAERAGFDAELIKKLSAHSLRAGFATTAAEKKMSLYDIAKQGRWKKYETVKTYVRNIDSFTGASSGLGM